VSAAAWLAGAAAACGVLAAWNALAAAETSRLTAAAARLAAPLARAGREGREPSAPERRRLGLVAAGGLGAAGWLLAGPALGVLLALAAPWAVLSAARARRRRYREGVQRGAAMVARALADALAGGAALRGAIAAAAAGGIPGPAGRELAVAAGELAVGAPTEAVLAALRRRAGGGAYDTIVAAALLQRDAGGDLAGLLREVAAALEDAARLEGDARAATAQARFTGLLVGVLPLGAAVLAELASPGYLAGLVSSPISLWLALCAAGLQALAVVAIRRLGRLPG
jgi:tight adherence protein B